MLSNIRHISLLCGLLLLGGVTSESCAPTAPPDNGIVSLVSTPSSLALTRTDSSQGSSTGLTCGCGFFLSVLGYGGDTSVIHFSFGERRDTLITIHNVIATFNPSRLAGTGSDSAWIALYTPNDSTQTNPGTPLYDTLRVKATY